MSNKEILINMKILSAQILGVKEYGADLLKLNVSFFKAMKKKNVERSIACFMWSEAEQFADECLEIIKRKKSFTKNRVYNNQKIK